MVGDASHRPARETARATDPEAGAPRRGEVPACAPVLPGRTPPGRGRAAPFRPGAPLAAALSRGRARERPRSMLHDQLRRTRARFPTGLSIALAGLALPMILAWIAHP